MVKKKYDKLFAVGMLIILVALIYFNLEKKTSQEFTIDSNCVGGSERVFDGNPETEANCPIVDGGERYVSATFPNNVFIYDATYYFKGEIGAQGNQQVVLQSYSGQTWNDVSVLFTDSRGGEGSPYGVQTGTKPVNMPVRGLRLKVSGNQYAGVFYPLELSWTQCTDDTWTPDPSQVACGVQFPQNSNCNNTRQAVGTMGCNPTPTETTPGNTPVPTPTTSGTPNPTNTPSPTPTTGGSGSQSTPTPTVNATVTPTPTLGTPQVECALYQNKVNGVCELKWGYVIVGLVIAGVVIFYGYKYMKKKR